MLQEGCKERKRENKRKQQWKEEGKRSTRVTKVFEGNWKKEREREKIKKMTVEKRNKTKEKRKGEEKDLETNVGPLRRVVSLPEFLKELSGHSENNDDSDAVREWFRRHPPNGPHYEMLENNRETIEMIENNSCFSWK